MQTDFQVISSTAGQSAQIQQNRVLRNTYALLGLSMVPTVIGALIGTMFGVSLMVGSPMLSLLLFLGVSFGLIFAIQANRNSGLGVALLWPWSHERFFAPWRPIAVSPIGVGNHVGSVVGAGPAAQAARTNGSSVQDSRENGVRMTAVVSAVLVPQPKRTANRLSEPSSQPSMGNVTGPAPTPAPSATSSGTKWSSLGCASFRSGALLR